MAETKKVFDAAIDGSLRMLVAWEDGTGTEYITAAGGGEYKMENCPVDMLISMHFVANMKAQKAIGNGVIEWHERFKPEDWWMAGTLVELGNPVLTARANEINKE